MFLFNRGIAILTNVMLITLICYSLSLLFWKYVSPNVALHQRLANPNLTQQNATKEVSLFATYALFGVPPVVKPTAPVKPKPKRIVKPTSPAINIEVVGILFGASRFAIIKANGSEETYAVGEYISYLFIEEIGLDYVLFDDDGQKSKVYVVDGAVSVGGNARVTQPAPTNTATPNPVKANVANSETTEAVIAGENVITPQLNSSQQAKLLNFRRDIRENPLSMIGKINVQPFRSGGKIAGFQVTPGAERGLFAAVGLKSGDVILSVNGKDLSDINDFTKGMRFMNSLSDAKSLDLTIRRRGQDKRIFVQLQN